MRTRRPYRQPQSALAERIVDAALELFAERRYDQITLAAVAERAGVGVEMIIRRMQTKEGLVRAARGWIAPQVEAARGFPGSDAAAVAAALERIYEPWGALADRTLRQKDASPALADCVRGGRVAHRAWIEAVFPDIPPKLLPALSGVCGVELWLVLRREGGLTADQTRDTVAHLIRSLLSRCADG